MAKRPGIPAGVKRLFRELSYADKVRKFRVLTGRDARDDEEMDEVFLALAADFWGQGGDDRAADDGDEAAVDGFA